MNFTREPIIETIVTPKEGYKLAIRNSKGGGQEEFFVDAVQVILIGNNCFYRSLEKPKPFLVPAMDYEILEVRETKMVMKLPAAEKGGIKIGGGKAPTKTVREEVEIEKPLLEPETPSNERGDRRRDRRRMRRQKDRFEKEESTEEKIPYPGEEEKTEMELVEKPNMIIPPPSTLISETIARYKDIPGFASAFFEKGKEEESFESVEEKIEQEAVSSTTNGMERHEEDELD